MAPLSLPENEVNWNGNIAGADDQNSWDVQSLSHAENRRDFDTAAGLLDCHIFTLALSNFDHPDFDQTSPRLL